MDSAVKNEKMSSTYVMQINKVRINKLKSEYHSTWVNVVIKQKAIKKIKL